MIRQDQAGADAVRDLAARLAADFAGRLPAEVVRLTVGPVFADVHGRGHQLARDIGVVERIVRDELNALAGRHAVNN